MKNISNKIKNILFQERPNAKFFGLFLLFILLAVFLFPKISYAVSFTGWVQNQLILGVAYIVYGFVYVCGLLLIFIINWLGQVAAFNDFINVDVVSRGWAIVRDLCNMFFILILLVIAFATILRIESYSAKRLLPKLLIMAVLINFSKTIFGLIIDFSQVIMLTFVNGFIGGGINNLADLLGMKEMLSMVQKKEEEGTELGLSTFAGILTALFASIISLIVILVLLVVLVMRIILLWIYTILSPFVFFGAAFPGAQKYTSRIWEDFIKQVIIGPVLAFFIWLALSTAGGSSTIIKNPGDNANSGSDNFKSALPTSFFEDDIFQKYIITIALLIGGLMVTQSIGGVAGAAAGKGLQWAKRAPMLTGAGAAMGYNWFGRKLAMGSVSNLFAKQVVDEKTGKTSWEGRFGTGKVGAGIAKNLRGLEIRPGKIIKGVKEGLKYQKEQDETQATIASAEGLRKGGLLGLVKGAGVSRDLTEALVSPGGIFWHKGLAKIPKIIRGSDDEREKILKNIVSKKEEIERHKKSLDIYSDSEIVEQEKKYKEAKDETARGWEVGISNERISQLVKVEREQLATLNSMKAKRVSDAEKQKRTAEYSSIEKGLQGELDSFQKKMFDYRPIQTFYADREREGLYREAQKKIGDNDNEEVLRDMLNNAIANSDKTAAAAVLLTAAKVGHLNEMMHSQRTERDITDEKGNIIMRKGEKLRSDQDGLSELMNGTFIKKLGMSKEQALSLQSEASSLAKSTGHYQFAESVGTKNGFLEQRTKHEQQTRARGELRKLDPEKVIRQFNRLGHGGEIEYEDGSRKFIFDELAAQNFVEMSVTINKEINGRRINPNYAMNIANAKDDVNLFIEDLRKHGETHFWDQSENGGKGGEVTYEKLAEKLIKYGENIAKTQQTSVQTAGTPKAIQDFINRPPIR